MPDGAVVSDVKFLPGSPPTLLAATYGSSIFSIELPGAPTVSGFQLVTLDSERALRGDINCAWAGSITRRH